MNFAEEYEADFAATGAIEFDELDDDVEQAAELAQLALRVGAARFIA